MDRKTFLTTTALSTAALFFLGISAGARPRTTRKAVPQTEVELPLVIIGSGYGAAVAALRLCEAGEKVTILEMGLNWAKSGLPFSAMDRPGESAAWLRTGSIAPLFNIFSLKPFTGALDRWDFGSDFKIWLGRGVGGGSLVNGGMAITPRRDYFQEIFPDLDVDLFYSKYFPLANQELKMNVAPEEFLAKSRYYKFTRPGEADAHRAGYKTMRVPNCYDFGYMQKEEAGEVPKSALAKEVIYGNNHGKNSLDKTYLRKALATGNLEILDLHHAQTVAQEGDGLYRLEVNVLNTQGEVTEKKTVHTRKLFLGAGSLGNLKLLYWSQAVNGFALPPTFGENWGNNGNYMTGCNWVNGFSGGTGILQSTIPVGGIDNLDDKENPYFVEIAPLPMGLNVASSLYLMVNRIPKLGRVSYNREEDRLVIDWPRESREWMDAQARHFIRRMNRAKGGTRAHFLFHNGWDYDIWYHPLGGMMLGKSTNGIGRVRGHKNLYGTDSSLIPGTVGVNPFVTITALAEYCMEHFINEDFKTTT